MSYLSNERVSLRAPEPSDVDFLYCWENNPSLWCVGSTKTPLSRYVLEKYLETAHQDLYEARQLRLIITLTDKPEVAVGAIDLFDFDPYDSKAGIGVLIAEEADRRHHYASDALTLLINYSFQLLGLHQLYCHVSANNTESLALFRKHGFQEVGILKDWIRWEQGFINQHVFQLINPMQKVL
jgi:diamine N-acetyltransferase